MIESSRIDYSMASAFLGTSAEKRMPASHKDGFELVMENREVRQLGEADLPGNLSHFDQQVDGLAVGLLEFDPQGMKRKHGPFGGFVGMSNTLFGFRDGFSGEETKFGYHYNRSSLL